jgi:adenosylmethionine-8-amino-7-oxononanoate aminotransferase
MSEHIGSRPQGGGVQHFWLPKGSPQLPRIVKGKGVYLWDASGRRYFDGTSGPVTCNLGHGNEGVLAAMARQAAAVTYAYPSAFESEANSRFADLLTQQTGRGLDRAFFVSGGSEATETCLKFARQYAVSRGESARWKVISRTPSYHGSTLGALAITGDPESERMFGPLMRAMPKVAAPLPYRRPRGMSVEEYSEACVQALEDEIARQGAESILAVMIEPICGFSGGASYASAIYYKRLREICTRAGALLIFDEVMSGGGRTGKYLAAHYWPEGCPDIVALAKGIGAGYAPLGGMIVRDDLLESIVRAGGFTIGHTYKTNPLACAVGLAVLEETLERDLITRAESVGQELRAMLVRLEAEIPIIGDVRGLGLLNAIEIVADRESRESLMAPHNPVARIVELARSLGLLLYARRTAGGIHGDWLMVTPPLITSDSEFENLVALLRQALRLYVDELRAQRAIA